MIGAIDKFSAQDLIAGKAQALGATPGNAAAGEKQKAAQEFVSLLFLEVLKVMRSATPKGGLFESEDSVENDVYTSLADTEIARAIAGREALGLRQMVEKALDRSAAKALDHSAPKAPDYSAPKMPDYSAPKMPDQNVAKAVERSVTEENHNHELGAPANGVVSSGFGLRPDPWTGENRFHKGLDIAAPAGSPVKAAAAGKVVFSGWAEGYGNLVTVDHGDGILTRYGHNELNLVKRGDEVSAGQEIALVGATGRATGPHLHFEVHKHGQPVDPSQVIGFQRVTGGAKKS